MRFESRVAIVTGAAKGIGAVTAEAFARARAPAWPRSTWTVPGSMRAWPR
jgi:hypothetical protein